MRLENRTPHVVTILYKDGETMPELAPVAPTPRCGVETEPAGDIDDIPIVREVLGAPANLPSPREGVTMIVSRLVAQAAPERSDLEFPTDMVRDESGRTIGCRSLGRI